MKRKDELFEQNVMRLVKQTGRSDQPSNAFVDTVMNQTLDQLQNHAGRGRHKGTTRPAWVRLLACAAAIVLLTGLVAALTLPRVDKCVLSPPPSEGAAPATRRG